MIGGFISDSKLNSVGFKLLTLCLFQAVIYPQTIVSFHYSNMK